MFCSAEDGDQVDERVILRCVECRGLSYLACTEEWLESATRDVVLRATFGKQFTEVFFAEC